MKLSIRNAAPILFVAISLIACTPKSPAPSASSPEAAPAAAPAPVAEAKPAETAPAPAEAVVSEGLVTFVSGEVSAKADADWAPVDTGASVPVGSSIKTGKDSYCEIQFGKTGSARIQENTTIILGEVALAAAKNAVGVKLVSGTIACKVNKLAAKDRFQVRTQTVVCGVRGTQFLVRSEGTDRTAIAVKEGKVALMPPSYDAAGLESLAKAPADSSVIDAVNDAIAKSSPTVAANQEATVAPADMALAETAYATVTTSVKREIAQVSAEPASGQAASKPTPAATAAPAAEAPVEIPAAVQANLKAYASTVAKPEKKIVVAGESSRAQFRTMSAMRIMEIPVALPGETTKTPAPALVKLTVNVQPADADLFVNGVEAGTGSFTGLYPKDSSVSVTAKRDGYKDATIAIPIANPKGETKAIKLESAKGQAPEAAPKAPTEEPAPVAVAPPPAVKEAAPPAAAKEAAPVVEAPPAKPSPVFGTVKLAGSRIIGTLVASGSVVYAADAKGGVSALGSAGAVLWSKKTGNDKNENSIPVASGASVAFAGDKFLAVLDSAGASRFSVALDESTSGLFGRRPAFVGSELYESSADGLVVLNAATGAKLRSVPLAEGSDMTPVQYGGKIVLAGRKGTVYIVDPAGSVAEIKTHAVQPVAIACSIIGSKAVFADRKGLLVSVDLEAKSLLWEKQLEPGKSAPVFNDLAAGSQGIYAFARNTIYGISSATGERLFAPIADAATAPLLSGDRLWFGTKGSKIVIADAKTGKVIASIQAVALPSAAPAPVGALIACPLETGEVLLLNPAGIE
jgi:outer membrane protein assembly factor BamB